MRQLTILLATLFLFTGCAKDYYTTFEDNSDGKVGSLQIKLSTKMNSVNVTIDNQIVAEGKHTQKIIVNNVPVGTHDVLVTGNDANRKDLKKEIHVDIEPGKQNTQLVEAPPRTAFSYILQFGAPIVGVVIGTMMTN